MNTTTMGRRKVSAAVVAAVTMFAVAACGTEVQAPTQDISGSHTKQEKKAPPQPSRTSERRMDFGDEVGTADPREKKPTPAGSGTRNRMDFRDHGI